jgi:5-methylcytosine-specific restriction endonuclease McrA
MPYLPRENTKRPNQGFDKSNVSFYASSAWRKVRQAIIRTTPLCAVCLSINIMTDCTYSGHVDHIIRIRAGGAKLDPVNLWVLCRDHHNKKSYLESRGYDVDKKVKDSEYVPTAEGVRELIQKII